MTIENFNRVRLEINAGLLGLNNSLNPAILTKINRLKKQKHLSVNIGAGPFGKAGWINIDLFKHPNITLRYDCRKHLPFSDNSVSRIRCEHTLEHFDSRDEAPFFLKECYRCLEDNGTLRIVVPDIELFVKAYCNGTNEGWEQLGFKNVINERHSGMQILNHVFRQDGEHKYGYDFITLKECLKEAGFKKISRSEWGNSVDDALKDDLENHRLYSLYVDCKKTG